MRFPRERIVVFAVLSLLIGAGLAVAATKRERNEAIYPPQTIPLIFSHKLHIVDVECEGCHLDATKSVRSTDRLTPGGKPRVPGESDAQFQAKNHSECDSCHDIEKATEEEPLDPKSSCSTCHKGFDKTVQKAPARVVFPQVNLLFNHAAHKGKAKCIECHNSSISNDMSEVELATTRQLPKMDTCLNCHDNKVHDGQVASGECRTCHLSDGTGRLAQAFTSGPLRPMQGDPFGLDHGPRFEFNHGTRAKLDRQVCMECHTEGSCLQCHDGTTKPLSVHPNDYLTLHPLQARMDSTRCEACHRFQSFCAACHERAGIGLDADPSLRAPNVRVHPNYTEWVDSFGPNHHAIAAARDIKSCMACHREESCMACHATGAAVPGARGTNPHPDGFANNCRQLLGQNNRACLKCHTAGALQAKPECR